MEPTTPKEALNQAVGEVQTYLETSKEYLKLQAFKMAMHLITSLGKALLVGLFAVLALVFMLAYLLRKRLEAPLLRHFSHLYFD